MRSHPFLISACVALIAVMAGGLSACVPSIAADVGAHGYGLSVVGGVRNEMWRVFAAALASWARVELRAALEDPSP